MQAGGGARRGESCRTRHVTWTRQIREDGTRTTNAEAARALEIIRDVYRRDQAGEHVVCPVLAYYGAGRAWLASVDRVPQGIALERAGAALGRLLRLPQRTDPFLRLAAMVRA